MLTLPPVLLHSCYLLNRAITVVASHDSMGISTGASPVMYPPMPGGDLFFGLTP